MARRARGAGHRRPVGAASTPLAPGGSSTAATRRSCAPERVTSGPSNARGTTAARHARRWRRHVVDREPAHAAPGSRRRARRLRRPSLSRRHSRGGDRLRARGGQRAAGRGVPAGRGAAGNRHRGRRTSRRRSRRRPSRARSTRRCDSRRPKQCVAQSRATTCVSGVADQVYGGVDAERPFADQAITATRGWCSATTGAS